MDVTPIDRDPNPELDTFKQVMNRRLSRRGLLKSTVAASTIVIGTSAVSGTSVALAAPEASPRLAFAPIAPSTADNLVIADGHSADVLLKWGEPIKANAPAFDINNLTADAQAQQFGYNCDFVGFLPLPQGSNSTNHGLLVVNHEYTNPEIMFAGYDADNPTKEQVDVELQAHGMSVVEIQKDGNGKWQIVRDSQYNRRITATTEITASGAVAGSDWLKTNADPSGMKISGTLNNCSAGKTPWGTVLTAEENFNQYFANNAQVTDEAIKTLHTSLGLTEEASSRKWERFYDRFDLAKEPNEAFRFGWVVEVDPYNPNFTPVKRTNFGRFKHEAATSTVSKGGQVVFYSGDDERFERVYKFVSKNAYNPTNREANFNLLEEGTLYAAKFNDDGTGSWLPLIHGQNGLDASNGFNSQADVLINCRGASAVLGATQMDRPEDIEVNPVNGKVYMALTNNTRRTAEQVNPMNPRAENEFGHVIELTETNDDHTATTFNWDIFLLAGDPADESTYFAGFDKSKVSIISCPDNVTFDMDGNLWIATDGQPGTIDYNDALHAVPVAGGERGYLRQFFSGIPGGEVCGPEFTTDNTSLFVAIQHPGEGGTFEEPASRWPDRQNAPRPSVIVITANNGGRIGGVAAPTSDGTQMPTTMPATGATGNGSTMGGLLGAAGAAAVAAGALLNFRARRMEEHKTEEENTRK